MRCTVKIAIRAELKDFDGQLLSAPDVLEKLDGLACHDDTVLNYLEAEVGDRGKLRGGYPRLEFDAAKGYLLLAVELDGPRKFNRQELKALSQDIQGQITDGIGEGCFNELSTETQCTIELRRPFRFTCVQGEGTAWLPRKSTDSTNRKKYAAIKKWIEKRECSVHSVGRKQNTGQKGTAKKPGGAKSASESAGRKPGAAKGRPNLKRLFRVMNDWKTENNYAVIKAELDAAGGDLTSVGDGELPHGNLRQPRILKLLLDAGLNPHVLDVMGYTLLYKAVSAAECVQMLLDRGVDVNRQNTDAYQSTALIRASSFHAVDCVKLLLSAGADPKIEGKYGWTVLASLDRLDVSERHTEELKAILRAAGAKR